MRFCHLTTFFPPFHFGGDAVFVANLANALVHAGHHVEIVHCADAFELLRGDVPSSPFPLDERVKVHTLRSSWGKLSPLLTYLSGRPMLKAGQLRNILAAGFDVVHWHNPSLLGAPDAFRYAGQVQLCTIHDYWLICPTSVLFKYKKAACETRDCLRCSLTYGRPPQPWRYSGLMRRSLPLVDRFLAPSVYVRDRMRLSHLAIECDVLPHFVPAATEGAPKATQAYYFFAGRLEKLKGLQTVIPVFGKTGRQLVIAGAGTYEEELRRQAKPFPNIRFLGRLSTQLLFPWYSGAKATIVPSICPETFGLTCVESLQAGTPVIASRFGALPELVADTGGGAVYGDTRELEAILDGIDHDPDRWVRLGKMGKSRLDKYSAQSHLENYFRIIDAVRPARANTP